MCSQSAVYFIYLALRLGGLMYYCPEYYMNSLGGSLITHNQGWESVMYLEKLVTGTHKIPSRLIILVSKNTKHTSEH